MILNCAIVDDEPLALELLRSYVEKTSFLRLVGRYLWGIERSGFFNGREKWAKGFENQRV